MRKFNPDREELHLWEPYREITIRMKEGVTYYGLGDLLSHEDRYAIHDEETNMVTEAETKPLQPLPYGKVVIIGAKASNFDDDIINHPRVELWNSQEEHWTNKDLPINTRAVFFTKWVGHSTWGRIMADARKRNITVYNHEGTGMIAKQVRELLDISRLIAQPPPPEFPPVDKLPTYPTAIVYKPEQPTAAKLIIKEEVEMKPKSKTGGKVVPKLHRLHEFIDWNKSNTENADYLLKKAKELGIETTRASLAEHVGKIRRAGGHAPVKQGGYHPPVQSTMDLSVPLEIFDNAIKALHDVRAYIVATDKENARLKGKLEKFRKFFED